MSPGGQSGQAAAVVAALRAVTGVADAEILPDPDGGPGTLRLQLAPGADEVLVATTVHRLLGDKFGLGVDAGRVQVVEEALPRRTSSPSTATGAAAKGPTDSSDVSGKSGGTNGVADQTTRGGAGIESSRHAAEDEVDQTTAGTRIDLDNGADEGPVVDTSGAPRQAPTEQERPTRLLISRMQLVSARQGVTSEVTLELLGRPHTGIAEAATTPSSVHRSVAVATLRAVEGALGGTGVRLELEHVETTTLGADRAVVVEVSLITTRGSERLTGVSAIREDARQAVIRATLDALNRRIETYLPVPTG
jgi:hypothetical protein